MTYNGGGGVTVEEYLNSDFRRAFILDESETLRIIWRRMLECVLHALRREVGDRSEKELLELIIVGQGHKVGVDVQNESTMKFSRVEKEAAAGELTAYFARQKRLFDLDNELDMQSFELYCNGRLIMEAVKRLKELTPD